MLLPVREAYTHLGRTDKPSGGFLEACPTKACSFLGRRVGRDGWTPNGRLAAGSSRFADASSACKVGKSGCRLRSFAPRKEIGFQSARPSPNSPGGTRCGPQKVCIIDAGAKRSTLRCPIGPSLSHVCGFRRRSPPFPPRRVAEGRVQAPARCNGIGEEVRREEQTRSTRSGRRPGRSTKWWVCVT
jgi:hypothetical protein